MRKAQVNRDATSLFFGQAIGVGAGQRFDQSALAVIDVSGSGENEMFLHHLKTTKDTKSAKGLEDETFDAVLEFCNVKIAE